MSMSIVARVSSCVQTVLGPEETEHETRYQINKAMKTLYMQGFRRMRVTPMARTGDDTRYLVQGF